VNAGFPPPGPDAGPASPVRLPRHALSTALRRTLAEFKEDDGLLWAAALTYYGVLSIFPALLVLVSIVGMLSEHLVQRLLETISAVAPDQAQSIIAQAVAGLRESSDGAGVVALIGLVVAMWSASGYVGAFMRASNAMYDVPEGRPVWKTIPIRIGLTMVIGVLLVLSAVIVMVTGNLASAIGRTLGLESAAVNVWSVAKWPVLVLLVALMFALLYWVSPNARQGGFRWVSPGGVVAVLLWILASVLFGLYAANFASYNKTYGTLAGVIVFLIWLWLSNLSILIGVELDAELERQRAIAAGMTPDAEPYLRLRDDRALKQGGRRRRT
jgi:membrane protein